MKNSEEQKKLEKQKDLELIENFNWETKKGVQVMIDWIYENCIDFIEPFLEILDILEKRVQSLPQ